MKISRAIGIIFVLILFAAGIWYGMSPDITLQNMREAANAKDSAALSEYVDFPALREDVKAEFAAAMVADAGTSDGLGAVLGLLFMDKIIDNLVTPAGIGLMFAVADDSRKDKEKTGLKMPVRPGTDEIMIERRGISEFLVRRADGEKGALVFRRDGLGWKLVGIDLPLPDRDGQQN